MAKSLTSPAMPRPTPFSRGPNALLIGMVLDQQVPMEKAFSGPLEIAAGWAARLDVAAIAAMSEEDFVALCSERPAIHRFPGSMGKRVHRSAGAGRAVRRAGRERLARRLTGDEVVEAVTRYPASGRRRRRSSRPCSASSTA